jgi:uncharacterized delta-60 repeat protein
MNGKRQCFGRAALLFLVNATLFANAALPEINYPPLNQSVVLYQQAAFGVIASGSSPLAFQWYKNGTPIPGATNDQVVLPNVNFTNEGCYSVAVSNSDGMARSSNAELVVNLPHAGDLDATFNLGGGSIYGGAINSIVPQPNGKVLLAGGFTVVDGVSRGGIARLNPDGSNDYTFMNGMSGCDEGIYTMALQADGKIIIAGTITNVNGVNKTSIARLNPDGSIDDSFECLVSQTWHYGDIYEGIVGGVAIQSDGKVLMGGDFNSVDGFACSNIVRLNNNGSVDATFHPQIDGGVSSIALQPDGKIVVGGDFDAINGITRNRLARLNANGSVDTNFVDGLVGAQAYPDAIAIQSSGQVIVGGVFYFTNGIPSTNVLLRLNTDGTRDSAFPASIEWYPGARVYSAIVQSDDRILICGLFTNVNNSPHVGMARLNTDGSVDETFVGPPVPIDGDITEMALTTNGEMFVTGFLTNGAPVARLNSNGTLDPRFQSNNTTALKVGTFTSAVQDDDKIVVGGGGWTPANSQVLARLNADATLDTTFAPTFAMFDNEPIFVSAIVVQPDQKIIMGGDFEAVDGVPCTNMARLDRDGSLDTSFHPPDIVFDWGGTPEPPGFDAVALQSDGKIIIGGNLTTINGVGVTNIARLNPDGSLDTSFTPPSFPSGTIDGLAIQSDGKILVAGYFEWGNGDGIVRLLPDGRVDGSFHATISWMGLPDTRIAALALQPDGKVLIGGLFDVVNGVSRNGFARLNTDGSIDADFESILGYGSEATAICVQTNGQLIIGRYNATSGANPQYDLKRLNADGSLDARFQTDGSVSVYGSIQEQSDGNVVFSGNYVSPHTVVGGLVRVYASDFPPVLKNPVVTTTNANVTWRAVSNRFYRVQYKTDLASTNWIDLTGDVYSTNNIARKSDLSCSGESQRFYRVMELP